MPLLPEAVPVCEHKINNLNGVYLNVKYDYVWKNNGRNVNDAMLEQNEI